MQLGVIYDRTEGRAGVLVDFFIYCSTAIYNDKWPLNNCVWILPISNLIQIMEL